MPPEPSSSPGVSRREFLERTALAAGAAGAVGIPTEMLVAEAARATNRWSGLPSPRNVPIDHFVLLMMENRSFDHYFGWLHGQADGDQKQRFLDPTTGKFVSTRPAAPSGPAEWSSRAAVIPTRVTAGTPGGRSSSADSWPRASGNDEFALSYYRRGELGFIHEAARQYTLYDRYFCSILAGTWPNRYYKWSAQSGGVMNNSVAARREQLGDHLRPCTGPRPDCALLLLGPALRSALGGSLERVAGAHLAVLRGRRGRQAAEHRDRGSALQGRERRRRALGGRAPARRRAARPGLPGRRGDTRSPPRRTTSAARCS